MEIEMNLPEWTKVSEIELVYKTKLKPSQRPTVAKSSDIYQLFLNTWDNNKLEFVEQFKIMLLSARMKVLGIYEVSTGTVCGCLVDPKLIFCAALKSNAVCLVLCHNHPSGNLKPSSSDQRLTEKLKQGVKLLEIKIIDHIIVTSEGYFSFADEGLL